ncbi:MAG: AAA family ATPase [Dysgonomonas sp.]|uniref:AAA family ATPase n=1 Tax=Dysgonomonas sp. TaxID=1891233 RepID=UPI0039E63598
MHTENTFKIIALETFNTRDLNIETKHRKSYLTKLKVLREGERYYFYKGFSINKDCIYYNTKNISPISLYNYDFPDSSFEINICSIVGGNGSGKSSLIELFMRIMNNLSTIIIGEYYCNPKAAHLHYIDDLYAKLYVQIGSKINVIISEGTTIKIAEYKTDSEISNKENIYFYRTSNLLDFKIQDTKEPHKGIGSFSTLENLFYTIIINYSLFSYNTLDLKSEYTSAYKEQLIRKKGIEDGYYLTPYHKIESKEEKSEARSWLKGLFHKNDGYQTPLVVNPMRIYGNIDINTENNLSAERLMYLLFKKDAKGNHFFKTISRELTIKAIKIRGDQDKEYSDFASEVNLGHLDSLAFNGLCACIIDAIFEITQIKPSDLADKNHIERAKGYIIYKTFKITQTYNSFRNTFLYFSKINKFDKEVEYPKIKSFLSKLLEDHSHITTKLWQSIFYLKYDLIGLKQTFNVEMYSKKIDEHIRKHSGEYEATREEELLPPPIFKIDFNLYNKEDKLIPFNTLSSGQKQITYTISSFLYHLINLDSVSKQPTLDSFSEYRTTPRISYKYINIIFDEIELYFHPEMQRHFINDLLNGLKQMKFENIKGIHIIFVTHSPFIISDIPKSNILFLGEKAIPAKIEPMKTFGANIHAMLKSSFFLRDGTMGVNTEIIVKRVISRINLYRAWKQQNDLAELNYIIKKNYKDLGILLNKFTTYPDEETIDKIVDWKYVIPMLNLLEEPVYLSMLIDYIPKKFISYVATKTE